MQARTRCLEDPQGKTFETRVEGASYTQLTGKRATSKDFATPADALAHAQKEELRRLRKGFIGRRPGLQLDLRAPYTGSMVALFQGDHILTNRFSDATGKDELVTLDLAGRLLSTRPLPGLIWQLTETGGELFCNIDHRIYRGEQQIASNDRPASFLSSEAGRVAFYDAPDVVVQELDGREVLRFPCQPDLYGGHTPQMGGALSRDGQLLAVCHRTGHLEIFDLASGHHQSWPIPESYARPLGFLGHTLVLAESYAVRQLSAVDPRSGAHGVLRPTSSAADALVHGDHVYLPERNQLTRLDLRGNEHTWTLDHTVKRCRLAVSAAHGIAVRTDLGCLLVLLPPSTNP